MHGRHTMYIYVYHQVRVVPVQQSQHSCVTTRNRTLSIMARSTSTIHVDVLYQLHHCQCSASALWCHEDFWDPLCELYKSLKTILGHAKPSSNCFLQFSLNFFNLIQSTSCSKFLSPIFFFLLPVFFLSPFFFEWFFSFDGIVSTFEPCRSNTRIEAKIPEPPEHLPRWSYV